MRLRIVSKRINGSKRYVLQCMCSYGWDDYSTATRFRTYREAWINMLVVHTMNVENRSEPVITPDLL
jgi:hypothetical protein